MIDKIKGDAKRKPATEALAKLVDAEKALDAVYGTSKADLSGEAKARILHGIRVMKLIAKDLDEALKAEQA